MIDLRHGDCLDILPTLPAGSVQMIVTSPPYFALRDYGISASNWPAVSYTPLAGALPIEVAAAECCLGLEETPIAFVAHLVHVFRLARAALRDDGVAWLNLGDSYAQPSKWGGRSGNKNRPHDLNRYPRRRVRPDAGLKDKDLYGMPWRLALALQADGWYLRSDVIWDKPNGMCERVEDRPTRIHEYLFLLAKSERYFYDADAIREPLRPKTLTTYGSEHRRQRNDASGMVKSDNWGKSMKTRKPRLKGDGTLAGANRRSIWRISSTGSIGGHYATFPEALVTPCILAGSRVGDTVLDPFVGSGTTCRVAESLGRNSIGIDLAYAELQARRTDGIQISMEAYV